MKVSIGDIIQSEFGIGKIVAITKEWIIHEDEKGNEIAAHKKETPMWIPVETDSGIYGCFEFAEI